MKDLPDALSRLKEEIYAQEKAISRGSFLKLEDLMREQGILFGLDRAHEIVYRVLAEDED